MSDSDPIDESTEIFIPKFCAKCGNKLTPGDKFCSKCGNPTSKTVGRAGTMAIGNIFDSAAAKPNIMPSAPVSNFNQYQEYGAYGQQTDESQPTILTPNQIPPVNDKLFQNQEFRILGFLILFGYISHIMRYLIIYNQFPNFLDFIFPLPFYVGVIGFIFLMEKRLLQNKGVNTSLEADYFDYMLSLILSSFFLTTYSYRSKILHESSTVPDKLHQPENTKMGLTYVEVDKMTYIGQSVRPKTYFQLTFIIIIASAIFLYGYLNVSNPNLVITFRLIAGYLGGLALTNVAPRLGKYNEEMSRVGKYRTLLLFLIAFFITIIALLGEGFLIALSN